MAIKSLLYNKHRIGVVNVHGQKHLFIEGEHIPAVPTNKNQDYVSPHLPYQKFRTLEDLGKAIVDYRDLDQKKRKAKKASS